MDNYDLLRAEAQAQLDKLFSLNKAQILSRLRTMDPAVFEHLTALVFEQRGFSATATGTTGDEGVDVMLTRGRHTAVVQCKRYENSIGQPTIRDLYGAMLHNNADEAYLVTTGMPTRQARQWAFGKPIHLVDGFTLVDWIVEARSGRGQRPGILQRFTPAVWLIAFLVLVGFGFAVGQAYSVLTERFGLARPVATDGGNVVPSPTGRLAGGTAVAAALTDMPVPTRPVETPNPPAPSTSAPATTVLPPAPTKSGAIVAATTTPPRQGANSCEVAPADELASLWSRDLLGCALDDARIVWAAWQPFENGYLLWRSDTDEVYAFLTGQHQRWLPVDERWDGVTTLTRGAAPAGLLAPERGFGYVWALRDDLFTQLGWAVARETGFCATLQAYANGFMLRSSTVASCTEDALYNHATSPGWTELDLMVTADETWLSPSIPGAISGGQQVDPASSVPNLPPGAARPAEHGIFVARAWKPAFLDGELDDWPNQWLAIPYVVEASPEHAGDHDLAGRFQLAWDGEGIYLALQVQDDRYWAGPDGSDMWQGDGIEVHFDRDLAGDFDDEEISDDDYQIGLSYGPSLTALQAYRWYPYGQERAFSVQGGVRPTPEGYQLEALIPWWIFDAPASDLHAGATFGFNLSLNDNDGGTPAQQTVRSTSPARTTFDDPSQWGALLLD